jgi:hypothetical protein
MTFVINKLKIYNNLKDEDFLPINSAVEKIDKFKIRPAITYGNNVDWSNIRREEDWILTMQIFVTHGNYMDLRQFGNELRKTIIKYCCSTKINGVLFSVDNISFNSQFESDYKSISILMEVNSKEVI